MPRQPLRIVTLLAAVSTLASCTTGLAMQGLNGVASCPPDVLRQANQNAGVLDMVQLGQSAEDFLPMGLSLPERKDRLTFRDRSVVEVWYYRTGHPRCPYAPTAYDLTPVVIDELNQVQAVGPDQLKPFMQQATGRQNLQSAPTGKSFSWAKFLAQGTM